MADPQPPVDLSSRNAEDAERFARENAEIDRAYMNGTMADWLQRKLADERRRAGFDT